MAAKNGDKVKVEYTGKFEDGSVFDSSEKHGKPLEFEVGKHQVVPGFEEAVIGMEVGEEKEVKIPPEKGYGQPNPELVQKVPKTQMPAEVKQGTVLMLKLPNGQIPATVTELTDNDVTIDMNHPLAGKTLIFTIKLVEIV
ncbi:peptidylprolyl isomerase [Nanoarchaeota archaeon]